MTSSFPSPVNVLAVHVYVSQDAGRSAPRQGSMCTSWTYKLRLLAESGNMENLDVYTDGPYGMPAVRWGETAGDVLLVAGGIGITPVVALLADLDNR